MNYIGIDGRVHSNELMHYKYIKKIGNRYFYTQDALRAYYEAQKGLANAEYVKDTAKDKVKYAKTDTKLEAGYALEKIKARDSNLTVNGRRIRYSRNDPEYRRRVKEINDRKNLEKSILGVNRGAVDTYRNVKREVKPVAKTAKRAVTPVASASKAEQYVNNLINGKAKTVKDIRKKKEELKRIAAKKIKKNQAEHRKVARKESRNIYKGNNQYKPAARW